MPNDAERTDDTSVDGVVAEYDEGTEDVAGLKEQVDLLERRVKDLELLVSGLRIRATN